MSRLTNDVNQVQQAVSETSATCCASRWRWSATRRCCLLRRAAALVVMTGAPVIVYPLVRLGQRVRRTTRRSQEQLEHLSHIAAEGFAGHRIVKAFGTESHEARRFGARRIPSTART